MSDPNATDLSGSFLPRTQEQIDLQKQSLGSCSWTFLHAFASTFPKKPSLKEQVKARQFLRLFSEFYPCKYCAEDFQQYIEENPPVTSSRENLSVWMCEAHNNVNEKLGKPTMDCTEIWKKWSAKHVSPTTSGSVSLSSQGDADSKDDDCGFCPEDMKEYYKANLATLRSSV